MNRRDLLKGLTALATVAAVPAVAIARTAQEWLDSGFVENRTFYLDEPLVMKNIDDFVIRNCTFIANEGFQGRYLLELDNCHGGLLHGGIFDASRCGGLDAAVYVGGPCVMAGGFTFRPSTGDSE